jgi:hypothetical protein
VAALVKRNNTQGVFVVDRQEKRARFVPVTLGIVNGTQAEILNPPLSDPVVTLGNHFLEDGTNITVQGETPKGDPRQNVGQPDSKPAKKSAVGKAS